MQNYADLFSQILPDEGKSRKSIKQKKQENKVILAKLRPQNSATHVATLRKPCCDFARRMLRLCATILVTLRDPCCDFAQPKLAMLQLRLTQISYFATLRY